MRVAAQPRVEFLSLWSMVLERLDTVPHFDTIRVVVLNTDAVITSPDFVRGKTTPIPKRFTVASGMSARP